MTPQPLASFRFQSSPLALTDIHEPGARFLYEYWQRKRGQRRMPARADIDPLELKPVLGRLLLIDVHREPLDFRYRLAGTKTYDIFGHDLTGWSVREVRPKEWADAVWASLMQLVETGEPQYVELQFETASRHFRAYRVMRLPLGSNGHDVDQVLICQEIGDERAALRAVVDRAYGRDPAR